MATIKTIWEVWQYDVWGNEEDGYQVNDRFCFDREYQLILTIEKFNPGTEREFESASPSIRQIKRVFGVMGIIDCDGDDVHIYVDAEDGYPIGEMFCVSHDSLSPIKRRGINE